MKFLFITFLITVYVSSVKGQSVDTISWIQSKDTSTLTLPDGYYLCLELEGSQRNLGFIEVNSQRSFLLGKNAYLSISTVDSIRRYFDKNFNCGIVDIYFNAEGAKRVFDFTQTWKRYKVALLVRNKIIQTSTLDSVPISSGIITIAGLKEKEIQYLINLFKPKRPSK
jgi:preprotein translocase subunit SecD